MRTIGRITGPAYMIWFISQFFQECVWAQNEECKKLLLQPTNFKLSTSKQGTFNLTWDYNNVEEIQKSVTFIILYKKTPQSKSRINVYRTTYSGPSVLHKGLSFHITTQFNDSCQGNVSKFDYVPEGKNGTAAENVSCVAYNTSSMNCTWIAGLKAPHDTRYNLSLTQKKAVEKCQTYKKDYWGRDIACRLHDLKIDLTKETYILVEGRSNESKIQFYDQFFQPSKTERLNPPSDIKVDIEAQHLTVKWKQPQTTYKAGSNCFKYEMFIQQKTYVTDTDQYNYTFPIQRFKVGEKYTLKMRSSSQNCGMNSNWGEWSGTIAFAIPDPDYNRNLAIVLGVIGGTVMALLLLLYGCKRYKVMQKICPRIPQPRNHLKDFEQHLVHGIEQVR